MRRAWSLAGTEPLLLRYGSAFFSDGNVTLPATGSYSRGKGTLVFTADNQAPTMSRDWSVVELRGADGARTGCQLSAAGLGTGDRLAVVAGGAGSVQLVAASTWT